MRQFPTRLLIGALVAAPVVASCQVAETGLGNMLYCDTLQGDFVVAGASTRIRDGAQTPTFNLNVAGIPNGATVVAAYANWSYLGNTPQPFNNIFLGGQLVTGQKSGEGNRDLVWGHDYAFAYTADVTSIITGNATYQVQGATDNVSANRIGEGISIVVVYELATAVLKEVNVYDGYTSTTTGDAEATLAFCNPYASNIKLFLNALDGQEELTDDFYVNNLYASDRFGLGGFENAWRGKLGPGASGRNYYDHILGDASDFVSLNDTDIRIDTDGFDDDAVRTDAIGHSFAAVSFQPVPEPGTIAVIILGLSALCRRKRSRGV